MSKKRAGWLRRLFGSGQSKAPDTDPGVGDGGPAAEVDAAGGTDVGRERPSNQDALFCDAGRRLFIVCDGMGGQAAGEQASRIAVEVLSHALTPERIETASSERGGLEQLLHLALQEANDGIVAEAAQHFDWAGMGSTAVIAVFRAGIVHVSNLGDSRAYLVRNGVASLLSRDHSRAARLVEHGQLTPEEARTHPLRNELLASLGAKDPVQPHYVALPLRVGDRLVLCSDGLWDMVADETIAQIAGAHEDPAEAVASLIAEANDAGGFDNIAVVVAIGRAGPSEGTQETESDEGLLEAKTAVLHLAPEQSQLPRPQAVRNPGAVDETSPGE